MTYFNLESIYHELFIGFKLRDKYKNAKSISKRFKVIKEIYQLKKPLMVEQHKKNPYLTISPYFLDWEFTPIEKEAWNQIRYLHSISMYPQFPIGRYFADFANPFFKIAIEMDGKEFHDEKKDNIRDKYMVSNGWKVFRIPGNKCFKDVFFDFEYSELENNTLSINNTNWLYNTCEGIITAISVIYFNEPLYDGYKEVCASVCLKYQCNG